MTKISEQKSWVLCISTTTVQVQHSVCMTVTPTCVISYLVPLLFWTPVHPRSIKSFLPPFYSWCHMWRKDTSPSTFFVQPKMAQAWALEAKYDPQMLWTLRVKWSHQNYLFKRTVQWSHFQWCVYMCCCGFLVQPQYIPVDFISGLGMRLLPLWLNCFTPLSAGSLLCTVQLQDVTARPMFWCTVQQIIIITSEDIQYVTHSSI